MDVGGRRGGGGGGDVFTGVAPAASEPGRAADDAEECRHTFDPWVLPIRGQRWAAPEGG